MKKVVIMMVMMLTIVVSTSGKNNSSNNCDKHVSVNVTVSPRPAVVGQTWRTTTCTCKCHKQCRCRHHSTICKKCRRQMEKGTHGKPQPYPMPRPQKK